MLLGQPRHHLATDEGLLRLGCESIVVVKAVHIVLERLDFAGAAHETQHLDDLVREALAVVLHDQLEVFLVPQGRSGRAPLENRFAAARLAGTVGSAVFRHLSDPLLFEGRERARTARRNAAHDNRQTNIQSHSRHAD